MTDMTVKEIRLFNSPGPRGGHLGAAGSLCNTPLSDNLRPKTLQILSDKTFYRVLLNLPYFLFPSLPLTFFTSSSSSSLLSSTSETSDDISSSTSSAGTMSIGWSTFVPCEGNGTELNRMEQIGTVRWDLIKFGNLLVQIQMEQS